MISPISQIYIEMCKLMAKLYILFKLTQAKYNNWYLARSHQPTCYISLTNYWSECMLTSSQRFLHVNRATKLATFSGQKTATHAIRHFIMMEDDNVTSKFVEQERAQFVN